MISSFGLYVGLMASFWVLAWLGLKLAAHCRWTDRLNERQQGHFQAVDGLRGVLALSVFVHHASCLRNFCIGGKWTSGSDATFAQAAVYAVTLFFFITGFLFWTKLQNSPRPRLGRFYRARLARLVPAYWACLVVLLLIVAGHSEWTILQHPLATLKAFASWLLFTLPGLDEIHGGPLICSIFSGVTWTLRLEWMFYLMIPFCGWFALRLWRTVLFLFLLVLLHALVVVWAMSGLGFAMFPNWILLVLWAIQYIAFCFSGGIIAAAIRPWIVARFPHLDFRHLAFSLLGTGMVALTMIPAIPAEYGWLESAWLFVPFLLVVLGNDWFGFLTSAPALLLGRISYSVYLLHGIVLYLAYYCLGRSYPVEKISGTVYWLGITVVGGLVIAAAMFWYRWFEQPFLGGMCSPSSGRLGVEGRSLER